MEAIKSKNGEWTSLPDIKKYLQPNPKNWGKINQALREMTTSGELQKLKRKWRETTNYNVVISADGRKALRRSTRQRRGKKF